jgi:hypothetical protein
MFYELIQSHRPPGQALREEAAQGDAALRRHLADAGRMEALCGRMRAALGPAADFLSRRRAEARAAAASLDVALPECRAGDDAELAQRQDALLQRHNPAWRQSPCTH